MLFDLSLVLITLGALAALSFFVYRWRALSARLSQALRQTELDQPDLNIPILGLSGSGKTLLLASLGEQLCASPHERLTLRLLSDQEESKLRGRSLTPFDERSASLNEVIPPGKRSTKAMIFYERAQFEQRGVNNVTVDPEDAYFKLSFETRGPLASLICKLRDVPGEYLKEERGHQGNIHPELDAADGLILVIDSTTLLGDNQAQLAPYERYQQAIERFFERHNEGPVWVVLTKADLLPEEQRDPAWWRQTLMEKNLRSLTLAAHEGRTFHVALTSASLECELGWRAIHDQGGAFLGDLREVMRARVERTESLGAHRRSSGLYALGSALILALSGWLTMGLWQRSALPQVSGEPTWDWGSLQTVEGPYLRARADLERPMSPISRYRAEVRRGLKALRRAYQVTLQTSGERWAQALNQEDAAARAQSEKKLREGLEATGRFYQALTQWEQRSPSELLTIERLQEALEVEQRWRALDDAPPTLELSLALLKEHSAEDWRGRCAEDQSDLVSCELTKSFERASTTLYEHSLGQAQQRSHSAAPAQTSTELSGRLEPLLKWRAVLPSPLQDRLQSRYESSLGEAWERTWRELNKRFESKADLKANDRAVERLRLLRSLEEERKALETHYQRALTMPATLLKAWRERLSRESVSLSEQLSSLPASTQQAGSEQIKWAGAYLDPNRRARVTLRDYERRWREGLKAALSAKTAQAFDAQLTLMTQDHDELSSLEGRIAIEDELKRWRHHLGGLKLWRAAHEVKLEVSELSCDMSKFEPMGIKIGGGSIWDWDDFELYFTLSSLSADSEQLVFAWADKTHLNPYHTEPKRTMSWSPWLKLTARVFEWDHNLDFETSGEDQESDDELIGSPRQLGSSARLPSGVLSLNEQGVCSVRLKVTDDLFPQWLITEGLWVP